MIGFRESTATRSGSRGGNARQVEHYDEPIVRFKTSDGLVVEFVALFFLPGYAPELNPDELLNGTYKARRQPSATARPPIDGGSHAQMAAPTPEAAQRVGQLVSCPSCSLCCGLKSC